MGDHCWENEKGITLIELLAALAISGMIITLVTGVLITGMNNFEKGQNKVELQNEANYILTRISSAYYTSDDFSLKMDGDDLLLNGNIISSNQFTYTLQFNDDPNQKEVVVTKETPTEETITDLLLEVRYNDVNSTMKPITVQTTLQKYEIKYRDNNESP